MSEHGIHVHGPHDHEVEHQAQHGGMGQRIAIFTAVLATIGAVVSFLGGHTQNEALLYKNDAVLKRAEASDQWNYYQAKSMKQNLAEFAAAMSADPKKSEFYTVEAARYAKEKKDIEKEARRLEDDSKASNRKSEKALHPHEMLAISMTLLQIAIALASITVLTKKDWLLWGAGGSALAGVALGVIAWF
ncbi:MAG TPA: DUF4337 domain-containing protein [Usitatibacteraceae bacterium]|nr:DUF4337 domain-containing protein [Usitatibacteraceae bacterium]